MPNLKSRMCAGLLALLCVVVGCNKAAPPPPAPGAPAPGAAAPGAAAPGVTAVAGETPDKPDGAAISDSATPETAAATGGPVPAAFNVDAAVQQKLMAVGAKLAADGSAGLPTRNDLKQIGLAFHNFHDAYNSFPAVNGIINPDRPSSGLSWRVSLLPYLDQPQLYEQFHLDEPWDSAHNKTLIPKMPKIFGNSPEGKSQVHVLTGKGAPFAKDQKLQLRDITDGSSNTIMAFVGGADTAEIWTKPEGRNFDANAPLQSLGNVGSTFLAVLMDGSVRKFPKSIPAEQFGALAQHQDGQVIGEFASPDQAAAGTVTAIKVNPPTTPLGPVSPKLDLGFIPSDAFLAAVVHPRRIYSHPIVQKIREVIPAEAQEGVSRDLPWEFRNGLRQVSSLRDEMGIALENIDEIVVILDKGLPMAMMNNPFGPPPFGAIVRNSAPLDIDGIVQTLTRNAEGMSVGQHEGVALILASDPAERSGPGMMPTPAVAPGYDPGSKKAYPTKDAVPVEKSAPDSIEKKSDSDNPCQATDEEASKVATSGGDIPESGLNERPRSERFTVAFINESVVLLGAESVVRKMISARTSTTATTGLAKQWDALGNPLFALAIDAAPLEKPLKTVLKQAPPQVSIFSAFILGVRGLDLTWDLDAQNFLSLTAQFKAPDMAQGVFGILDGQLTGLKEQYQPNRDAIGGKPASAVLMPYMDHFVNQSKLATSGDTITFVVPKIADLDKLPEALKPAIEEARKAALLAQKRNNLKQVGLAMHNFESTFTHLPALNGRGEKSMPGPGLSWRVYLLPFLDESNLYSQFKLDEPWDSEHNKALIPRMPKLFGDSKEGKTSIHVFTGKGAPFQVDVGVSFFNILDGTSNTIMAIEAGDDTADIWTKPGGLEFDVDAPLKCLGSIREFNALLFDGSVRSLSNLDADTFSKLVQHADGMQVQVP